jgi:hypothetical protein
MLQRNMATAGILHVPMTSLRASQAGPAPFAALRILHAYCIEKCPTAWIFILFPANA